MEVEAEVGCGASTAECALWVVDALVSEVRPSELQPLDKEREEKKERASQQQLLPSLVCVCVCVCELHSLSLSVDGCFCLSPLAPSRKPCTLALVYCDRPHRSPSAPLLRSLALTSPTAPCSPSVGLGVALLSTQLTPSPLTPEIRSGIARQRPWVLRLWRPAATTRAVSLLLSSGAPLT